MPSNKSNKNLHTIIISPLSAEHIELLVEIDEVRLGATNRKKYLKRRLELCEKEPETHKHFVAISEAEPVGHLGMVVAGEEASIETLAVSQDGKGIATSLVLEAGKYAQSAGAESMGLEVRASNKRALKLYSRFGLAPVGVRQDYYPPNKSNNKKREDAVSMWCHLVQSEEFCNRLNEIAGEIQAEKIQAEGIKNA